MKDKRKYHKNLAKRRIKQMEEEKSKYGITKFYKALYNGYLIHAHMACMLDTNGFYGDCVNIKM